MALHGREQPWGFGHYRLPAVSGVRPNSWMAIDPVGGAVSFAVCYSPSGAAIKGATSPAAAKKLLAGQAAQVQRLKAQRAAR